MRKFEKLFNVDRSFEPFIILTYHFIGRYLFYDITKSVDHSFRVGYVAESDLRDSHEAVRLRKLLVDNIGTRGEKMLRKFVPGNIIDSLIHQDKFVIQN